MGTAYTSAVGVPPVCTSLAFRAWLTRLLNYRLAEIPLSRTLTYYFSQSGADANDGLTIATAKKTLAAAQAVHDAWSSTSAGLRLRFNRGDVWRNESAGLAITKSYVTIDDYGTANLAKPVFTKFQTAYSAGGWSLTAAQTFTYERAETGDVAAFREVDDRDGVPYIRQTSIATTEATAGSFWPDPGNKVYVRPRTANLPTSASVVAYESALTNTVKGISTSASADNIRIENIVIEGYGAHRTTDTLGNWPFTIGATGTSAVLLVNCEAYYGTFHNIGQSSASGGILTCVNCRAGRMPCNAEGTNFVSFASTGGQEALFYRCRTRGGNTPRTGNNYTAPSAGQGTPVYAHTSSSTFALVIAWECEAEPDQYSEMGPTTFANAPSYSDLADCRAFVVDDVFRVREPSAVDAAQNGTNDRYVRGQAPAPNVVYINPNWTFRQLAQDVGNEQKEMLTNINYGVFINPRITLDWRGFAPTSSGSGVYAALTQSPLIWRMYNGDLLYRVYDNIKICGCYLLRVLDTNTYLSTGLMFNTIIRSNKRRSQEFSVAWNNNTANLKNNLYVGCSNKTATRYGYDQDPYLVEADDSAAITDSLLLSANQQLVEGYRLEYDANWKPRNSTTAIGPYELERGPLALRKPTQQTI